jgi:hypothetical protein
LTRTAYNNKMKSIQSYLVIPLLCLVFFSCSDKKNGTDDCLECPVVTSIAPSIGKSGDTVTINGSNFSNQNIVRFNGKIAKTIQQNPNYIVAYVPANCGTGGVTVERSDNLLSNNDKEFTEIYQYTVSTYAGMPGSPSYYDGSISYCFMNLPSALAIDKNGDLYICDEKNYCVRKIIGNQITTIAGKGGTPGYLNSPDPKTALFNTPAGIAISPNGEVFIGDHKNHCIRDVLPSGIVTAICGNPQFPGYLDGDGTAVQFNYPYKMMMLDDQNFLVVDSANNRIRQSTVNGTVTTFAGSGTAGSQNGDLLKASFYLPAGMALMDTRTVLVAEAGNNKIRSINLTASTVSDFAGYGKPGFLNSTLANSMFNNPSAIAVRDMNGKKEIFIADTGNNMIRMIDSKNNVSTVIGDLQPGTQNGDGVTARLNGPTDLVFDPRNNSILYIADKRNHTIRKVIIE